MFFRIKYSNKRSQRRKGKGMSLVILRAYNTDNIAYRNPDICFCFAVLQSRYLIVSSASAETSHRIHNT